MSTERNRYQPQSEGAALKHGLRARPGTFMPCRSCPTGQACEHYAAGGTCQFERDLVDTRLPEMARQPGIDGELDAAQCRKVVWQEIFIDRGLRWIAAEGGGGFRMGKQGPEPVPALTALLAIMKAHGGELDRLGQTPASRAKLRALTAAPGSELARLIQQVDDETRLPALPAADDEGHNPA